MADLTVDGTSSWNTGTPDARTALTNGPPGTGTVGDAKQINGLAEFAIELQAILGSALSLKGSVADLATRLNVMIAATGALQNGTSFPANPANAQLFYKTDEQLLYIFNSTTGQWQVAFNQLLYALLDGSRSFTGDIDILKASPALRLTGQEGSAIDVRLVETGGNFYFQKNNGGTFLAPNWATILDIIGAASTLNGNAIYLNNPIAVGAGSTRSHEGSVIISNNQNMLGIHFCTDFTLNQGITITVPSGNRTKSLVIVASGTITINGTIFAAGAGGAGSAGGTVGYNASFNAEGGTDQPGGGGAGASGVAGGVLRHGIYVAFGGVNGAAGMQLTGSDIADQALAFNGHMGGGGGSGGLGGGASPGGQGGRGGGTIVLVAPTIILAATATLNTGADTGSGGDGIDSLGGGGGGAGNVYITARSFIDNGATFTQPGGGASGPNAGGVGAAGIKQVNILA